VNWARLLNRTKENIKEEGTSRKKVRDPYWVMTSPKVYHQRESKGKRTRKKKLNRDPLRKQRDASGWRRGDLKRKEAHSEKKFVTKKGSQLWGTEVFGQQKRKGQ